MNGEKRMVATKGLTIGTTFLHTVGAEKYYICRKICGGIHFRNIIDVFADLPLIRISF